MTGGGAESWAKAVYRDGDVATGKKVLTATAKSVKASIGIPDALYSSLCGPAFT